MLTRFAMSNYRGFQSYQMEGLTQVNLLVGMNNSGKTAILEGIQFLETEGEQTVWDSIASRRGELISPVPGSAITSPLVDVCHLFHSHQLTASSTFSLRGDGRCEELTSTVEKTVPKGADTPSKQSPHCDEDPMVWNDGDFNRVLKFHALRIDNSRWTFRRTRTRQLVSMGEITGLEQDVRNAHQIPRSYDGSPVHFLGSESLNSTSLAHLWDEITRLRREKEIVSAMQIIDPKVESVQFLTGMMAGGYYPSRGGIVVGRVGEEARQPLGSMGEGIWRLMALAMTLTHTRNGCLLIDEIDTGLHYSVMTEMWELVVKHAIESNVQVFATTHSWDCIEGLAGFCQKDPDLREKVSIHKIDRKIPHSIPFGGDSIVRLVKADIDPR